jgi:hypothetical protein
MTGGVKPIEKVNIDEAASEKLSRGSNKAVGKIEVIIETRKTKVFHFRLTRRECELKLHWAKVFAGIVGLVRLLF